MSYLPLPRGDFDPISTLKSTSGRVSSKARVLAFFGTAALSGILFHLLLVGFSSSPDLTTGPIVPSGVKDWWRSGSKPDPESIPPVSISPAPRPAQPTKPESCPTDDVNVSAAYVRPGLGNYVVPNEDYWTLDKVKGMVSKTKGYYVRDYSLGLGWNNMRYIVETSLLHAQLLNRTLVLPSFVYARACEWNITVCASYAPMVNRGDAIGWSEWRELPIEQQMGWRIPINIMLDLANLRKWVSVITVAEYLQLHDLSPDLEWSNGAWHRDVYHQTNPRPSFASIPNGEYDPSTIVRVDKLTKAQRSWQAAKDDKSHLAGIPDDDDRRSVAAGHGRRAPTPTGPIHELLITAMGSQNVINLADAEKVLADKKLKTWTTQSEFEQLLEKEGWAVLDTFAGVLGMDYTKSVVEPLKQIAPISTLRGLVDDYDHFTEDVLLLEGETHLNRKPGSLRFTTVKGRENFADIVLHGLIPIPPIRELADRIATRLYAANDGRLWMAGHMRRGDFVRLGWSMENTVEAHFGRIKTRIYKGAKKIQEIVHEGAGFQTYDVPNVKSDPALKEHQPPKTGDKFYIATDERSPEGLTYIRANGGILISDLLSPEERRIVGWPLLFTDILALLEQAIMSHAAYFYAHAMSSVAGGVVNMRAAKGADPRTTLVD